MYLNNAIKHKTLDTATSTILHQDDEDKCWSLYLSCVANPFVEDISFEDFMKKYGTKEEPKVEVKPTQNIQKQVLKAEKMLKGFVPPNIKKGGVK